MAQSAGVARRSARDTTRRELALARPEAVGAAPAAREENPSCGSGTQSVREWRSRGSSTRSVRELKQRRELALARRKLWELRLRRGRKTNVAGAAQSAGVPYGIGVKAMEEAGESGLSLKFP